MLTRLTEAILAATGHSDCEAFALDASGGKRSGVLDLANVLGRLAGPRAPGQAVGMGGGEPVPARGRRDGKPGLTVALCGANYVTPRELRPPVSRNGKQRAGDGSRASQQGQRPASQFDPLEGTLPRPAAVKAAAMTDADPNALAQALLMTQQSLAALQRMQEQTAALHKQFLESQEAAQRTLHALVEQQQALLVSSLGAGVPLPPAPPLPAFRRQPLLPPSPPTRSASSRLPHLRRRQCRTPTAVHPRSDGTAASRERVAATLLAVVSEKTGYPAESLDLTLSLDADLGVDSIKRVEILSALQERLPGRPGREARAPRHPAHPPRRRRLPRRPDRRPPSPTMPTRSFSLARRPPPAQPLRRSIR